MNANSRGWQGNNFRHPNPQNLQWPYHLQQPQRNRKDYQQPRAPFMEACLKHACCPRCRRGYDLRRRIPMILQCNHSTCKECLHTLSIGSEIKCGECGQLSGLREKWKDASEKFEANYYLVGQLYFSRFHEEFHPGGTNVSYTKESSPATPQNPSNTPTVTVSRKCSYVNCAKESSLWCADCKENYCDKCSHTVHSSAKGLKSHKVWPLGITMCETHSLPREFSCQSCSGYYCSYCIIHDHNGHIVRLNTEVDKADIPKLQSLMQECKVVLKNLNETNKKVHGEMLVTDITNIKTSVSKCFTTIHNKLQKIESTWNKKFEMQLKGSRESMEQIRQQLNEHIGIIRELMDVAKLLTQKKQGVKHDVKLIVEQMENARKLVYDFKYESYSPDRDLESFLESCIKHLDINADCVSCDVGRAELVPAEIQPVVINASNASDVTSTSSKSTQSKQATLEPVKLQKNEIEKWISSVSASTHQIDSDKESSIKGSKSSKESGIRLKKKENVVITHLDNPHCIYVHLKKQVNEIEALHKDLAGFVNRLVAGPVSEFVIGNLYLARCNSPDKPNWCRAQLVNVDKSAQECKYEVFYIDYGNGAKLKSSDFRQLPESAKALAPYAYECRIKGIFPVNGDWDSKTNKLIAEILSDCHILMVVFEEEKTTLEVDLIAYGATGEWSIRDTLIFTGNAMLYDQADTSLPVDIQKSSLPSLHNGQSEIKMQKSYDVLISHVNHPHSFYVQLKEYQRNLEALMMNMFEFYKKKKKGFIYTPQVGQAVAVKNKLSTDNIWYRGTIVAVVKGKGTVDVFLVDTGKMISVKWDQLRKLSDDFLTSMCLAFHVKLKDIAMTNENLGWNEAAVNHLKTYTDENRILKMTPHNIVEDVLEITLFEVYPREHICINSSMVSNGLAQSTGHLSLVTSFPCYDEEPQADEMFTVDLLKTSQGDTGDDSDTEDYSEYKFIPVKVLRVKSPGCIYIHFPEERAMREKLETLQQSLQIHYIKTELTTKTEWNIGEFGIGYNQEDRQYYRILIEEKKGQNYKVFSRDYAFFFEVDTERIGVIDDYFLTQPPFAYRCHVNGVKPLGKSWSLTATDFLKDLLMNRKNLFFAKVGATDKEILSAPALFCFKTCKPPSALEPAVNKMHNINKELVKNGLAIPTNRERDRAKKRNSWSEDSKTIVEVRRSEEITDTVSVSSTIDIFEQNSPYLLKHLNKSVPPTKLKSEDEVLPYCVTISEIYPHNAGNWLPALAILRKTFSGVVTYVDERAYIYLHFISEIETLSKMEEIMTNHFETVPPASNHKYEIGDRCSVKYRNGKWYRGIIMSYNVEDDEFRVCMVDYGNIEEVIYTDLRREIAFPDIPILAKRIELANVYPKTGKYNTSEIDVLHKLVVDHEIKVEIINDLANPPKGIVFKHVINVNKFMVNDLPNCTNTITSPRSDVTEEDVVIEEEILKFNQPELPKTDMFLITLFNLLDRGRVVFEVNEYNNQAEQFQKLSRQLMMDGENQPQLEQLQIDAPCIAKYSEDQQWYRGKIYEITKSEVTVLFVDYGNIEMVDRSDIRVIKPDWLKHPIVQYIAYVNYFKDLDEGCIDKVTYNHIGPFYNTVKRAKIVNDEPLTIDIYEQDEDTLTYASLIEEGVIG